MNRPPPPPSPQRGGGLGWGVVTGAKDAMLKALKEPTVIFSGSAREAVPAFPANIDVAAALSLAGIRADKTGLRILADPTSDKNIHEIEAEGDFGKLFARTENMPSPHNPKISYMAALSAIALVRRITSPLVVGT